MSPDTVRGVTPTARRARTAVALVFALNGIAFASFLSRTPAIRSELELSTPQLGLLLLCLSAGAVAGLPLSGPVVHGWGPARTVRAGALATGIGLCGLAAGLAAGAIVPAALGLVLTGLGMGVWDVAMNVEGADVERRLGRSLMPRLHAAFSLGTVGGAALGASCAAVGVALSIQVAAIAVLVPALVTVSTRAFVTPAPFQREARSGTLDAWRERRTLLVGVLVLCFAFTEGTANDWIAVALVDGYDASETAGAIAFGTFVAAMTLGRLVGGSVLARFGRAFALRATAALALAGVLLVVFGDTRPVALAGTVLWGLGASLGFPVGMSAAADEPGRAAARVSVVSSIGYTAFLAGPPAIGVLAGEAGILRALLVVAAALTVGFAVAGATRPVSPESARAS